MVTSPIYQADIDFWRECNQNLLSLVQETEPVPVELSLYSDIDLHPSCTYQEVIERMATENIRWMDRVYALRYQLADQERQYIVMRRELNRLCPEEWPLPEDEFMDAGEGI